MAISFDFATAPRILFGRGCVERLGEQAARLGRRVLIVHGEHLRASGELARVARRLAEEGLDVQEVASQGEPETDAVDQVARRARDSGREVVIGIGGGATLDLAKAAAGLATNEGSVMEYLEGVGTGRQLVHPALPLIAVPTTAGTGSEVTRNAVVTSRARGFKKSLRSHLLLPSLALVDPALTDDLPPAQTAASGLDALIQLIEPYVSSGATPMTDALALEGIRRAVRALPRAYRDGADREARDELALASLLGGICLANAGLGAVHGLAAALGAHGDIPHGLACACVLVQAVEANLRALEERAPESEALRRYALVGEVLVGRRLGSDAQGRGALVAGLRALTEALAVPRLGAFGFTPEDVPTLVRESRGSSMRFNPIVLEDAELDRILRAAM